jgi:hypothetical protein
MNVSKINYHGVWRNIPTSIYFFQKKFRYLHISTVFYFIFKLNHGLDSKGFTLRRGKIFLFSSVQIGSGAHSAFYPKGTTTLSLVIKQPEHEADHSHPTMVKAKNSGAMPLLPHTSSWCDA